MSDSESTITGYRRNLERKLHQLQEREKQLYEVVMKDVSTENIRTLNNCQMDIATIKSRLYNLGKKEDFIGTFSLPYGTI